MKPLNKTANDLFQKLRAQFSPVTIGNEDIEVVNDPYEARFFTFQYTEKNKPVGTVSISIIDNRSLKIYFNHDMIENITSPSKWYSFLKDLRFFAKQNLLMFDTRDIQKDQLDSRDFEFIKQNDGPYKEEDVEITESKMYGSKRKSKQQFENATLIVYHKKTVDEEVRGSRSRHIDSIFIESNGEKFRFPVNYLNGARAMAVHVSEGGTPYDNIGKHIIETVREMRNLSQFARITRRHAMEDEEASNIRNRVVEAYQSIRKDIMRMQNVNNYKQFAESFKPSETTSASDVAQLQEKFTVKVWNKKMDDLLPSVQRALESSNEQQEAMGAPDYNPAAGQYSSNMEYGMFTPQGNEEVEEIVQAACDMVEAGSHDVMSATDAAMNMLTDLAEATSHDEAEDTEVRENVAREIASRCDSMNEEESVTEEAEECKYCGGDCPNDENNACDGYSGDIDGLYEASPSVEKTIKDPNFVLVLKKDDAADNMLRRTQFKTAQGLLAFAMSDIATRIIGSNSDAVANFASDMMINVGEEGETFGTRMTPEYKRDKQLAMMLAKKYINDIKRIATDSDYANEVRKDPSEVYGAKKKRSGGYHESVDSVFENWVNELIENIGVSANQQVIKALSGGDTTTARNMKRVGDKLARGQKLTPSEMPIAGEIAKKTLTTKKPAAALQALANSETNSPESGEVAIAEKTLRIKNDDEKDYDGDGKIESPRDEYMGSRDKAIKKAMKKKPTAEEIDDSEDDTLFQESLNLIKTYAGI